MNQPMATGLRPPSGPDFATLFAGGLDLHGFLDRHGTALDRRKWLAVFDQTGLNDEQKQLLGRFTRRMPVLCMAGAWCGDCARQCPVLARIAECSPCVELRFVDRDACPALAAELQVCGSPRVPQALWMSEDFEPVLRAGDRTLSQLRELRERTSGASCSTGILVPGDPRMGRVTAEWLEWFETAQLILQTSPKLLQRHGG